MRALIIAAAAMLAAATSLAADQAESRSSRVMIVLDASGSMWGRLNGEPKIAVARRALSDLLADWRPAGVGFTAYGHRRKGDCRDIETLVPPENTDPRAITSAAEGLNPKGKTPLSAAVAEAAETLRYTGAPARVILLSDGRETCNADPCAIGSALEREGVDFTAHVIGFDVSGPEQAGLRCLAENTGGHFYPAGEASALRAALGQAAEQVEQDEAGITLKAVDRVNGPALRSEHLRWSLRRADNGQTLLDAKAVAVPELDLAPGRYIAQVSLGPASAEKRFEVGSGQPNVQALMIELSARLDAPANTAAGGSFEVGWKGPASEDDYLTLVKPQAAAGDYGRWWYVREGNPLTLRAPGEPGDYEVRYVSGNSGTTLATAGVAVERVSASVSVPETVRAGGEFQARWQGPDHKEDYLTIVAAGAEAGSYGAFRYTREGNPLTLRAPDEPGSYEVRYLSGYANETVASAELTVEQASATVEVPDRVTAGSQFPAEWRGPDNKDDYLTIVKASAASGSYGEYSYTREGKPLSLRAPNDAGDYEVRYLSGQSNATVARAPLTVTAPEVSVTVPESVKAGARFEARWQGPDNKDDYLTIVPAGAKEGSYSNFSYTRQGNPLRLRAPDEPGSYEVRYLSGQGNATFARTTLTVAPLQARIEAPGAVAAGEGFEVTWSGPGYAEDYLTLVPAGAPSDQDGPYVYTRKGGVLTFKAPDEPGAYELRYRMGQSARVLTTTRLTVE